MNVESLHDFAATVVRAQRVKASLQGLAPQVTKSLLSPLPVPLCLTPLEDWITAAEEAVRRPRIAESKKLLLSAGFESSGIPGAVLGDVDRIKACVEGLKDLPQDIRAYGASIVGRSLVNGVDEALRILENVRGLAASLSPLLELRGSCPAQVAAVLSSLPQTVDAYASYLKDALRIRDLLEMVVKLHIQLATSVSSVAELQRDLSEFARAYKDLLTQLTQEGLASTTLDFSKDDFAAAVARCDAKRREIAAEKNGLEQKHASLVRRLAAMGVDGLDMPSSVRELRESVADSEQRLASRHNELVGSLGEDAVTLMKAAGVGELPRAEQMSDEALGRAFRRSAAAGFTIRMEPPDESK
jgi:hypothetical protein